MKTPSFLIDQDFVSHYEDRYTGRLPIYLHMVPEAKQYECNPEYINLFLSYINGDIDEKNLSRELYLEVEDIVNNIPNYGQYPMPYLDPFYECAGITPSDPSMIVFVTVNLQYDGAVFYTADLEPYGVMSE